jgi:hypothetical protein
MADAPRGRKGVVVEVQRYDRRGDISSFKEQGARIEEQERKKAYGSIVLVSRL